MGFSCILMRKLSWMGLVNCHVKDLVLGAIIRLLLNDLNYNETQGKGKTASFFFLFSKCVNLTW